MTHRQSSLPMLTSAAFALCVLCLLPASGSADEITATPISPVPAVPDQKSTTTPQSRIVGSASCAAASCHGGGRRIEGLHYAASLIWAGRDPHASAWDVLNTTRSRNMLELLGAGQGSAPPAATQDARCLNCHATVEQPLTGTVVSDYLHHDGVGCEACHGAARDWIGPHVTAAWKRLPAAQKLSLGYVDLASSLTQRANRCAECHVGGVGRDVNHDLIAAGHPRLDYEFSTFHTNYPRHWQPRASTSGLPDPEDSPTFPLDAWQAGQFAAAEACLKLLEDRTAEGRPWPELAEYSCFSCHHNLEDRSWYQQRRSSGRPAWETWNLAPLRNSNSASLLPLSTAIASLETVMNQPQPDRQQVRTSVTNAVTTLAPLLTPPEPWTAASIDQFCLTSIRSSRRTTTDGSILAAGSWDELAQLYLGLRAAVAARRNLAPADPHNAQRTQLLEQIRTQLLFRPGYDSPGTSSNTAVLAVTDAISQLEQLLAP